MTGGSALNAPSRAVGDASAGRGLANLRGTGRSVLMLAGWREARWLMRSPLVLGGLAVSVWLVWLNNRIRPGDFPEPATIFWWAADVNVVACLLPATGGALLAAQLAAGRSRRDGMEHLYRTYPASAATRSGAHLLSVAGPLILAVVFIVAAVAWVAAQPAIGQPRWWVLAAGLLLVALGGVLGTALGSWLRHPMTGILVALALGLIEIDLVLTYSNPIHLAGGIEWLFPWVDTAGVLTALPGLTVPYPPPAHLAELAGLIALAGVAALWPVAASRRAVATIAVAALAITGWSGWDQVQGVSTKTQAAMASQVILPGSVQRCQLIDGVRYCYYPAFAPLARQWADAVDGVLARVPGAARTALTVRQVWDGNFFVPPLLAPTGLTSNGGGAPSKLATTVSNFQGALSKDPRLIIGSSMPPVYTDANWGTGSTLGAAQLALAISAAEWATGLPTTGRAVSYNYAIPGGGSTSGTAVLACVPVGQARAAIAAWLAAGATPAARSAFVSSAAPGAVVSTQVGRDWVATVQLAGSGPSVGLNATVQAVALARRMLRLPARQVESVLARRWESWLRPAATTAELASALAVPLPRQPVARPSLPYTRGSATYGVYTPPTQTCG